VTPREAYIILNLLPRVGPIRVKQMLQHVAGPAHILERSPAELARIPGIGDKLAEILGNWRRYADLDDELAACEKSGVRLLTLADDAYPAILREIHDPPLCLYVRGDIDVLADCSEHGLAMVGSRHTTHYGQGMAERLAAAAVQTGWIPVSGLARGIDTVVHQATVKHEGRTVAVIAGGLQHITPPENLDLARRIAETGAVISEQPLRMAPDKRMFPMRNRIISGLCRGTLVVEAGAGSGSLITARLALEQDRAVFAVPGRADTPHAAGCHALIKDGAKLVETIDDVLA
jgi:DNA processing protein